MENYNYEVEYLGDLRTESKHIKSGEMIISDAPTDNNGKGESFSPTDMIASSLVSCILTVWGIHYRKKGQDLKPIKVKVQKVMLSDPRRVGKVNIEYDFGENNLSEDEFKLLYRLAAHCPVANSLSPELKVESNLDIYA